MKNLLLFSVLIFVLASCNFNSQNSSDSSVSDKTISDSDNLNKDSLLLDLSNKILTSIKDENYKQLAEYIHPELGVRFSAYAFIDTISDIVLTKTSLIDEAKKQNKLLWGSYDGSGEDIRLTQEEYFDSFVYDADFINAEQKSVNEIVSGSTTYNNLDEMYPDCDFVELYFSGFDKQFDGLDWCSLRLVFKKHNDKYYLVGVIHDQWTV